MTNRQKSNDGYNQYKKPMDKSKYKTWPCDKGYKCPYRRVDEDGNIVKNYCTFIHYPYDLCPFKEDCQNFQTQDCVWKHNTKPKPKPKPVVVVDPKPNVAEIIKDQSEFPLIGKPPTKTRVIVPAVSPAQLGVTAQASKPQKKQQPPLAKIKPQAHPPPVQTNIKPSTSVPSNPQNITPQTVPNHITNTAPPPDANNQTQANIPQNTPNPIIPSQSKPSPTQPPKTSVLPNHTNPNPESASYVNTTHIHSTENTQINTKIQKGPQNTFYPYPSLNPNIPYQTSLPPHPYQSSFTQSPFHSNLFVPNISGIPGIPGIPNIQNISNIQNLQNLSNIQNMQNLSNLQNLTNLPNPFQSPVYKNLYQKNTINPFSTSPLPYQTIFPTIPIPQMPKIQQKYQDPVFLFKKQSENFSLGQQKQPFVESSFKKPSQIITEKPIPQNIVPEIPKNPSNNQKTEVESQKQPQMHLNMSQSRISELSQSQSSVRHSSQLQFGQKELNQFQGYTQPDFVIQELRQQRTDIEITKEIEKLAKEVLRYNVSKNQFEGEDYENTIKLAQILKLSNDLRQIAKIPARHQPQIIYQPYPASNHQIYYQNSQLESHERQTRNQQSNQNQNQNQVFETQSQGKRQPNFKKIQEPKNQAAQPPKQSEPVSRKNSNGESLPTQAVNPQGKQSSSTQDIKAEEKKEKIDLTKRVIMSLEQIAESSQIKNAALSQFLLNVFLDFITEKDHIEFKFEVDKRKFEIVQKFHDETHRLNNNQQRYSFYSIEVLEQSHFEELCETIAKYSYQVKKTQSNRKNSFNQSSVSLIKPRQLQQNNGPEQLIKQFFLNIFEYIQFYFKKIRKDFKDKTLDVLDLFYKFVNLPEDIVPANTPEVSIQDPNHFKGPIYVGGLRTVCMRFFARIYLLFLDNNLYAIMKFKQEMKTRIPTFDSKTITKFMEEKQEETKKKLTGNLYKDNIECNKKKRPMDKDLICSEVKDKLVSQMIVRSHHLINQIALGEKETLLSWESMKEYLELKAHEEVYTDYLPETEVNPEKVEMIKIICKGQIWIEESDRKKYNQKEKNRFSFLQCYFLDKAVDDDIKQEENEFIANKTIQIGERSYATLLSDGKYIIEEPFELNKIQEHQNEITTKLKEKNSKSKIPPYHQTKIFYYAKGNTGISQCNLESLVEDSFFKNKVLDFTSESPYLIYCNNENGFLGSDSVDSFKIRIYREGGLIEFLNAKSQEQCKRYFGYILEIMKSPKNETEKISEQPLYFYLSIKPEAKPLTLGSEKDKISELIAIQSKEKRTLRHKKQHLSIVTWNLKRVFESDLIHRQISKSFRIENIIEDLKNLKSDIVCLQEVKDFKKQIYEELCENSQLYFMPFHEDIGEYESLILTRFPVKFSTVKIATQKWACCEFKIESLVSPQQNEVSKSQKNIETEEEKQKPQPNKKELKKLSVLVMSVHLKCTEMDSEDSFLSSTATREKQLKKLEDFFQLNEDQSNKKYDLVILAGDFNIDDIPAEFKLQGETVQTCDHNAKYLKHPSYFDLQAELHPQTLETCKTYLHKGLMDSGRYRIGGTRIDRILVRSPSSINIDELIPRLKEFSLIGNYSLRNKENANEVNYDKFTRSPSDHFGVYMEILFNL